MDCVSMTVNQPQASFLCICFSRSVYGSWTWRAGVCCWQARGGSRPRGTIGADVGPWVLGPAHTALFRWGDSLRIKDVPHQQEKSQWMCRVVLNSLASCPVSSPFLVYSFLPSQQSLLDLIQGCHDEQSCHVIPSLYYKARPQVINCTV